MSQPPNPPRPGPQQPPYANPPYQNHPVQGQPPPPYGQHPQHPQYAPRPQPSAETRRDVEAAWAARLELGLDFEQHIAAGLADRVEQLAAYRAGELRHEAELNRRRDAEEQSGRGRQFALGIVSVVMGVPITAIAGNVVEQDGLTAIAISWIGLIGVNAVHALGLRRSRRSSR